MTVSHFTEEVDSRIYKKLAKEIVSDIKSNECNEVSINTTVSVGHGKWTIEADMVVDFSLLLTQPNIFVSVGNIDLLEGKITAPDDQIYFINIESLLIEIRELCGS